MEEALEKLIFAIEQNGNLEECEEVVASNFEFFIENDIILTFPDELIFGILSKENIKYPSPKITADFFLKLFKRGNSSIKYFVDLIPYYALSKEGCIALSNELVKNGFHSDARHLKQVSNLYDQIEGIEIEISSIQEQHSLATEQAKKSAQVLEKMTELTQKTSKSLDETSAELTKKEQLLKEKQELLKIAKNKKQKVKK